MSVGTFRYVGILVLALVTSATVAVAQPISQIDIRVVDGFGNGIVGIEAELESDYSSFYYSTASDSNGDLSFYSIPEGNYTLRIQPSQSDSVPGNAIFQDTEGVVTLTRAIPEYITGSDSISLADVTLTPYSRYFEVTVTDRDSNSAVAGLSVYSYLLNDYSVDIRTLTDFNGVAVIGVPDGSSEEYFIQASGNGYGAFITYATPASGASVTSVIGEVSELRSTITFDFIDADTYSPVYPYMAGSAYPSVSCHNQETDDYFSAQLSEASSSATLNVLAGSYECDIFIVSIDTNYAAMKMAVSVADNESRTVTARLAQATATLDFQFVTASDGSYYPLSIGDTGSITCNEANGKYFANVSIYDGPPAPAQVVPGEYTCEPWLSGLTVAQDTVRVEANETATPTFEVFTADATIIFEYRSATDSQVALPNGTSGNINCYPLDGAQSFSASPSAYTTSTSVSLIAGTYSCSFNISGISIPSTEVTIGQGETATVPVTTQVHDATLALTAITVLSGDPYTVPIGEQGQLSCWNDSGYYSATINEGENTTSLSTVAGHLDCDVIIAGVSKQFAVEVFSGSITEKEVALRAATSDITVQLVNGGDLSPFTMPSATWGDVRCFADSGLYSAHRQLSSGDSSVVLALAPGKYTCTTWIDGYATKEITATLLDGDSLQVRAEVYTPNATITVNLRDASTNNAFLIPQGNTSDSINCMLRNSSSSFYEPLSTGDTSKTLSVVAGTYDCEAWIQGYVVNRQSITVTQGSTASVDLTVTRPSADLTVNLIEKSSGLPYTVSTGASVQVDCFSTTGFHSFSESLEYGDSSVVLRVTPGSYSCSVWSDDISSLPKQIAIGDAEQKSISLELVVASASLTVELVDALGNSWVVPQGSYARVDCFGRELGFSEDVAIGNRSATLALVPGTYTCSATGDGLIGSEQTVSVTDGEAAQIQVQVQVGNSSIQINLVSSSDQSSFTTPEHSHGNAYCYQTQGRAHFDKALQPNSTSALIAVVPGRYECRVWLQGYQTTFTTVSVGEAETVQANIEVTAPDASIVLSLQNAADQTVFQVPESSYGNVYCQRQNGEQFIDAPLNAGDSQVELSVVSGTYSCQGYLDGFGLSQVELTAQSNETAQGTLSVFQRNATVRLRLVNAQTGGLITDRAAEFSLQSTARLQGGARIEDHAWEYSETGEATLAAIGGILYEANVFFPPNLDDVGGFHIRSLSSTSYLVPDELLTVLADSNEVKTVDFQLTQTSSKIKIVLRDVNGNPVNHGWANAFSPRSNTFRIRQNPAASHLQTLSAFNDSKDVWSGTDIVNGHGEIPVVAGRSYRVNAFPDFSTAVDTVPPEEQIVTVQQGETHELEFQLRRSNYRLNITGTLSHNSLAYSPFSQDFFACYGNNTRDQHSFAETFDGTTLALPLEIGEPPQSWTIGCYAVAGDGVTQRYYHAQTTHLPAAGTAEGTLSLTLSEGDPFYSPNTYEFDASLAASFTLPDNKTIVEIPAKALANSGNATMTVGSATGFNYTSDKEPLLSLDISFEVDGTKIEVAQKPVIIRFAVDTQKLAARGIDITQLKAASYDERSRVWRLDASYIYDPETETLVASLTHFSIWGSLIELSRELQDNPNTGNPGNGDDDNDDNVTPPEETAQPTDLRSEKVREKRKRKKRGTKGRKSKNSNYQICWQAPQDGETYSNYEIELITLPNKKKQLKRLKRKRKVLTRRVRKLSRKANRARSEQKQLKMRNAHDQASGQLDQVLEEIEGVQSPDGTNLNWTNARQYTTPETCYTLKTRKKKEYAIRVRTPGHPPSPPLIFQAR